MKYTAQKPLTLDKWHEPTGAFIHIYEKFPILYDGNHPLYGKYEDKVNAMTEMRNSLLTQHKIDFNEEVLISGIDQLHTWYYSTKIRRFKPGECYEKYFQMCKFLPEKCLRVKIVCSICNKNFQSDHVFKYHLWNVHKIGNFKFQCELCGKKLISKSALLSHSQRVHSAKKYPCEFCGKMFAIRSELRTHTLVHTTEKPHVCELCGKGFRLRNNLGVHITRMHKRVREFKCTMCPKDFFTKALLKDHIKTHLNIRDKICETCGKGFTNSHSLSRHRQLHSEVKKFACKLCDAKFYQFVGLNGHMKRTHNIVKKNI